MVFEGYGVWGLKQRQNEGIPFSSQVDPSLWFRLWQKQLRKRWMGTYTRMLWVVKNVSRRPHMINCQLYGWIPKLLVIIRRRRLALADHVSRHKEPAVRLLSWLPEEPRRVRPNITIKDVLCNDTGLNIHETSIVMADRENWRKNYITELTFVCSKVINTCKCRSIMEKHGEGCIFKTYVVNLFSPSLGSHISLFISLLI